MTQRKAPAHRLVILAPPQSHRLENAVSYAALMVHVQAHAACEPRLRLAAGLADQLGAALIGVCAELYTPPPQARPVISASAESLAQVEKELQAELHDAEARFRRLCGAVSKGAEWRAFRESPVAALARESRAADLVIGAAGGEPDSWIRRRASPADLLMACGRPVLAGPG